MPAAARNLSHLSVPDEPATTTPRPRGARTHKPTRGPSPRYKAPNHQGGRARSASVAAPAPSPNTVPTPVTVQDWQQVRALVEHFNETDEHSQIQQARAVRRRTRRHHRPFHLSLITILVCAWLFGLLVTLLWWNSRAASASHLSLKLDNEIARMRLDVASAQRKISSLDSDPHLATWARQRQWTRATSDRIDEVTRIVPPRIAPPSGTQPVDAGEADASEADAVGGDATVAGNRGDQP